MISPHRGATIHWQFPWWPKVLFSLGPGCALGFGLSRRGLAGSNSLRLQCSVASSSSLGSGVGRLAVFRRYELSLTQFRGNQFLVGGGTHDAEIKTPYPAEFRPQMGDLVRSGRSPDHLVREFEPSAQSIRSWVVQADRHNDRRDDGMTAAERREFRRLRRGNRRLRKGTISPSRLGVSR